MSAWVVGRIEAAATHDLRRRVLRVGTPSRGVCWAGDAEPGTVHLAVRAGPAVLGVATLLAGAPGGAQLRGMAVEPAHQGAGIGLALLRAAARVATEAGAEVLWANARDTALGFYTGAGMSVIGPGFVTADTGLPHHRVETPLPLPQP